MSVHTRSAVRARPTVRAGAAALCLALLMAACDEPLTGPTVAHLLASGTPWRLQSLTGQTSGATGSADAERFTVQFAADGRVSVLADCNRCGGGYVIAGHQVTVGTLVCTRAFCPSSPFDAEFLKVLGGTADVRVGNGMLTLSSPRGTLTLVP